MSDLDARVAALMDLVDEHAQPGYVRSFRDRRAEIEKALRAELQKPAMHEPVTDAEIEAACISLGLGYRIGWPGPVKQVVESVLQGRAKPEEAFVDPTDPGYDVAVLREQVRHLERQIRQLHAAKQEPAQEEITDALPTITDEDQQFLHYNPNTSDLVEWIQDYARAAIRINKERVNDADLLDFLQANPSLETSCEWCEDGDPPWVVHSVNGGRNDREWKEVGRGITLRDAIKASIRASKGEKT